MDELSFVKLKIPRAIPKELIEQVKGRAFTVERFYNYQEAQIDNPYNHLYALIDKDLKMHGYLWAEINMLDDSLFINTFSISKQYWNKGTAMPIVTDFLKNLVAKLKVPRVMLCTTNANFFKLHGFRKSKIALLEYNSN